MNSIRQNYYRAFSKLRRQYPDVGSREYEIFECADVKRFLEALEAECGVSTVKRAVIILLRRTNSTLEDHRYPSILYAYIGYYKAFL